MLIEWALLFVFCIYRLARYARRHFWPACILLSVVLFGIPISAQAVPPGTVISNTARASFQIQGTPITAASNTVALTTTWKRTPSHIELLQYAPAVGNAESIQLPATQYSPDGTTGSTTQSIAAVHPAGSTIAIDLSSPVPLSAAALYHQGEPIFFRVIDPDQNIDPQRAETIWVLLTSSETHDTELLLLTETGPDTGIFIGYLQSSGLGPAQTYNGLLDVTEGGHISAQYTDVADPSDSVNLSVLVDPYGLVFDSATGQAVDQAGLTLINVATGQPAVIYGDDGVSTFPATITSGGTFTDSSGKVYAFPRGAFRFPFVAPGQYRLAVTPPGGYAAPSTVSTSQLQTLPGAPFAIAEPGSRGEPFILNPGPALRIDIPMDPTTNGLWVRKLANVEIAAVGDFIQYTVSIQNSSTLAAEGVTLNDRLPLGFRYRAGSARLDGQPTSDPVIFSDGRSLAFAAGRLAAGSTIQIRYVAEVGAGTKPGKALNRAQAVSANGLSSNTAAALVRIKEELFRSKSFIAGRVIADNCADEPKEADGVAGVRIYLENGTYVVTDSEGKYHFEGVKPGTHVVQLDLASLPLAYEMADCDANSRMAGTPYSHFVDLQGGTLWREDFHVKSKPAPTGEAGLKIACDLQDKRAAYQAGIDVRQVALDNVRLTVVLPEGSQYSAGTSRLGGQSIGDPEGGTGVLVYRLGAIQAGQRQELAFEVDLNGALKPGRLHTKAMLSFDTPSARNQRSEAIDTILDLVERKVRETQPTIVVRPLFETYSDRLLPAGKELLDNLAERLQSLEIEQATVVGHTDNLPVRTLSHGVFPDNQTLSEARARRVSEYLAAKLNLQSRPWSVSGKGDSQPLRSNDTEEGRAYNRRVEVTVLTVKVKVAQDIAAVKCEDQNTTATQGAKISPPSHEAPVVEEKPPIQDFSHIQPEALSPGFGWLMPEADFNPAIPSLKVAIQHAAAEMVELMVNGRPASAISFEGRQVNKAGTVVVSMWRGLDLADGANQFVAVRKDRAGTELERIERTIYYAGFPVRAALDKAASRLIANGKDEPVIAVQLFDGQGRPARPGLSGEFSVEPPFEAQQLTDEIQRSLPQLRSQNIRYTIGVDGIARIRLKPTTHSGQAVIRLQLEGHEEEIRAWLQPEAREWILVGLAEGTAGYNTVSGNMEQLEASDAKEDYYQDGRIAFFAKGKIKGNWLLTAAFDSTKDHKDPDNPLFQTIDPGTYYTLYGDAAQQQYEAASIRKLYLKIERDQFYALFGDFDTGLTVTELSRYSRRLNGLKSEYDGQHFGYNLFAADTSQAYVRDEIQGQGISGLYHLSRQHIVINSDKINIQTRDRFRSEVIISSQNLMRFVDYSIDYEAGTLFFKNPIYSRDENFNPIFIVAEYESEDSGDEAHTYGGRGAAKFFDNRLEVGTTAIHQGPDQTKSELGGLDARLDLGQGLTLKAEAAATRNQQTSDEEQGEAYLAELHKTNDTIDSKIYYREMGEGFGLGQQNGSEGQTRKVGADAAWRLKKEWTVNGEIYRYDNLATSAQRDFVESDAVYRDLRNSLRLGGRVVRDQYNDGTENRSTQVIVGASRTYLEDRLQLRVTREQSLGGEDASVDFPTRTLFGADYKLSKLTTLFAEHEITQGQDLDSQSSRVGFKATPWTGGQLGSSIGNQTSTDGQRLFANLGLFQSWRINSRWNMDGGLDRSQSIESQRYRPFNPNVPTAAGAAEDFSAATLGLGYKAEYWSWTGRVEERWAETEDKLGLVTGIAGEVKKGLGLSAGLKAFDTQSHIGNDSRDGDLRLSLAWRPAQTRWIIYDRLDYIIKEVEVIEGRNAARRIVNNFNANYRPIHRLQIALQYGAKYVFDTISNESYSGYTDLPGLEARYDLTKRWDIGVHASMLHSWQAEQMDYRTGLSVGYNVIKNAWISLGYNLTGFHDEDFSAADYTAQGPFIKFRLKFDQQTVREMVDWFSQK